MSPVNFHVFILSTTQYHSSLPMLQGVKNSVEEFKDALNTQSVDVKWCHDKSHADALEQLQAYVAKVGSEVKKSSQANQKVSEDFFLFYFCGHGFIGRHQNLMFGTTDTSDKNYSSIGISCDVVVEEIKQAGIKNFILILDCCHSGRMTEMGRETRKTFEAEVDSIVAKLSEGGGAYVTSTSKSVQNSKEIELGGIKYAAFTHYFAQALHDGIGNANPYISLASLIKHQFPSF